MQPLWLRAEGNPERLVLARLAQSSGRKVVQGVLLDWEKLQGILTDEVRDLFPDARMVPLPDGPAEYPERVMTALPVMLDPGPLTAGTTYYWRIDAKDSTSTTTGDVWAFVTSEGTCSWSSLAGGMAMRKAAMDASPVILEPVMDVTITVPEKNLGDIMSDVNGRRGKIAGTEPGDGTQTVRAQVPESELQKFALDLRSITQGRGTFSRVFSHYEEMPQHLAKPLIEAFQKARSEHE